MDHARDALRDDGVAWLNIGDKSNGSGGAGGDWAESAIKGRRRGKLGPGAKGPGKFSDPAYREQSFLDVPGAVLRELLHRGWRLRLPIVWNKGRESPESLKHVQRGRWCHEMIYMLSPGSARPKFYPERLIETGSIWSFPPGGAGDSHLAPFPDELVRRCVVPSTNAGDIVLDPFAGSGTTMRVAEILGRRGIGVDLYAGVGG